MIEVTVAFPTDTIRVEWSLDHLSPDPQLSATEVHEVDALDAVLDAIARDAPEPVIAELVNAQGARLGVGLAASHSVLSFNASVDPPYFVSAGTIGSEDDDVAFYFQGHWTEFPASALVTNDRGREAARRFLITGARPENVTWEEV